MVKLVGEVVTKTNYFCYLQSVLQSSIDIKRSITKSKEMDEIEKHIQGMWLEIYEIALRLDLLYGSECWANNKNDGYKISVVEMRMLNWMNGKTEKDKIRNEETRTS